jgi:hypothetical protein
MATEITKQDETKKPFRPGSQPIGIAARKAAAAKALAENKQEEVTIPPGECPDRIGIVMDDSGSMSGDPIKDAHKGIEEFLRSCRKNQTAVAVYPMNASPLKLSSELPAIAQLVQSIRATGGTPAVETLGRLIDNEPITRAIMFSDGSFNMHNWESGDTNYTLFNQLIRKKCNEKELIVDTVYIGPSAEDSGAINLKKIAEDTGGIFMHFVPGKCSFASAFKYLTSGNRLMLMDKSFKEKVERGEV